VVCRHHSVIVGAGRGIRPPLICNSWMSGIADNHNGSGKPQGTVPGGSFYLLNRTNLGLPIISTFAKAASGQSLPPGNPSPSAGQITYTSTTSLQIQLGLKLLW
jgi:hypothetical protein